MLHMPPQLHTKLHKLKCTDAARIFICNIHKIIIILLIIIMKVGR